MIRNPHREDYLAAVESGAISDIIKKHGNLFGVRGLTPEQIAAERAGGSNLVSYDAYLGGARA